MPKDCLSYIFDLPNISCISDISREINISEFLLYQMSVRSNKYYREVLKLKSNGGVRVLACPSKKLKAVQAWILREILDKIPTENVATAFVKGKNIKHNVDKHSANTFVVCMDITNFFGSIPAKWVYTLFHTLGYNKHVSHILTNYTTYNDGLPQGGVTSPALSNILCKRLDRRIMGYVGARNITYSRYADDITLSGNDQIVLLQSINFVKKIIDQEGFRLNEEKFRVLRPGRQKRITGLIVSDRKEVGIGRKKRKILQATIYNLEKDKFNHVNTKSYYKREAMITGWLNYLKGIDPYSYEKLCNFRKSIQIKFGVEEVASTKEENK